MVSVKLTSGKGDFVRWQKPNGEIVQVCNNVYNVDFSQGCIAQVPDYLMGDVLKNNGMYSEETKNKLEKLPDLRCTYCYAKHKNRKTVEPKEIDEITENEFREYKPEIIRVGKLTEPGHWSYRETLNKFLSLCKKYSSKATIPTKMLAFDKEVAKRMKEIGGVISFSIGYDKLEPGCVDKGYSNAWRIEQAEKYEDLGVNTLVTIVCHPSLSIEQNLKSGSFVKEALESKVKTKRIIPLRAGSKKRLFETTGIHWHDVKGKTFGNLFSDENKDVLQEEPFMNKNSSTMTSRKVHPDFEKFEIEKRICGQVGDYEYCDKCNLSEDKVKFPVSEIVKVEKEKKEKKNIIKEDKKQTKIKF